MLQASSSLIKSRKASDTKLDYSQIRVGSYEIVCYVCLRLCDAFNIKIYRSSKFFVDSTSATDTLFYIIEADYIKLQSLYHFGGCSFM